VLRRGGKCGVVACAVRFIASGAREVRHIAPLAPSPPQTCKWPRVGMVVVDGGAGVWALARAPPPRPRHVRSCFRSLECLARSPGAVLAVTAHGPSADSVPAVKLGEATVIAAAGKTAKVVPKVKIVRVFEAAGSPEALAAAAAAPAPAASNFDRMPPETDSITFTAGALGVGECAAVTATQPIPWPHMPARVFTAQPRLT